MVKVGSLKRAIGVVLSLLNKKVIFITKIVKGKLQFGSDYNEAHFNDWCKKNEGAIVRLEPSGNPVSDNMRGYYFGAVIPFIKSLVPEWQSVSTDEVHEILKKNFNSFDAWNPVTKRMERYGQSVMNRALRNKKAAQYVDRIGQWVEENYGQSLPSPEDYQNWKDNAHMKGEEYGARA